MPDTAVRLFQRAICAWSALYVLALLLTGDAVWTNAPVRLFRPEHGASLFPERFDVNLLAPSALVLTAVIIALLSILQMRRHRWWVGLVVWGLFRIITHRTWLASNGGVQLMENMLIWCSLMGKETHALVRTSAFWIGRLQLILAYAAAAAHKYTGTAWLDGTAVMMVARDPAFHLHWLTHMPWFCMALTYAALTFMTLFPLAVWWSPSRRVFLAIGVLFHLSTAVFMGIPQMGLAFIACYPIWLDEKGAHRFGMDRAPVFHRITSPPSPGSPGR